MRRARAVGAFVRSAIRRRDREGRRHRNRRDGLVPGHALESRGVPYRW